MIISEVNRIGACKVCYTVVKGDEGPLYFELPNKRAFTYVCDGSGRVEHLDIGFSKELTAGVLHDLRPTVTSAETVVYANTDLLIAATFFVEDDSRKLDAEVLSVGTHAITKTSGVETVFTLLGEVLAGGVPIESKKFAYLPDDRAIEVVVPEGAVAIHFKRAA